MPRNGMTNDPRDTTPGVARSIVNFDIVTDPKRAIPYFDSESGDSGASTLFRRKFCIAYWTPTPSWRLFGLGNVNGQGYAAVYMKTLSTGGSTDLSDAAWLTPALNESAAGLAGYEMFHYYKKTGKIHGFQASRYVWEFTPDGSTAWVNAKYDYGSTFTNCTDAITHSQDDIMYFGIDNKIIKNDNGTFAVGLTLPNDFYVTSICEYGAYLAVACAPLSGEGKSRVYLWNRSSTLATVSANVDWGQGVIKVLEELEGYLMGISLVGLSQARYTDRIVFRYYAGSAGAKKFKEFNFGHSGIVGVAGITAAKQKIDNRVYFQMAATVNGAVRDGVWSIANTDQGLTVQHERTINNDTAINSSAAPRSFFIVGDFIFQSYVSSASVNTVSKTNDQLSYTATSIIETVINPNMSPAHRYQRKKLVAVGAMYDPLPTAGQVVVKARADTAGSYTTIYTETTDAAVYTEPASTPSGGSFINDGKEFEFQINSTGGAVPTALIYVFEVEESNA